MKDELAVRFTVSIPPRLMAQLDQMLAEKGYANRS
jgi:metal-responsive CopG/Arc/MetJ family transcriptional regulator